MLTRTLDGRQEWRVGGRGNSWLEYCHACRTQFIAYSKEAVDETHLQKHKEKEFNGN